MSDQPLTFEQFRYDPEKGRSVLVKKGKLKEVAPEDLPPGLRKRFKRFIAEHARRKSA